MRYSILARSALVTLFVVASASGQIEWEKYYGGSKYEFSAQLLELSDHNLLICGYSYSFKTGDDDADIWLLKVSPAGDTIWTRTYGGEAYDCATAAHELTDGSLLIAGSTKSFSGDTLNRAYDIWLLKLTAAGDTVWTKIFPGSNSAGAKMAVDAEGNIFIAGNSIARDPKQDVQVIKCSANGTMIWTKHFGGADREDLNAFCRTADGSMLLLATSQSSGAKTQLLFKIKSNGDTLWSRTYGNFDYGNASDIIELPNGTYMMSGTRGQSTEALVMCNLKPDGSVNWEKSYTEFASNEWPVFHLMSSGNFFVSSVEMNIQETGDRIRLIRMDSTGAVLWTDRIGEWGTYTHAADFIETSNGAFLMLGSSNKLTKAADDMWLVSLTPDMYVDVGGVLKHRLIATADSLNHTYKLVHGPASMTVSSGGMVTWAPQTSSPSSELVEVAIGSAGQTDTIGFIVHANKKGTAIRQSVAERVKNPAAGAVSVRMTPRQAVFTALQGNFRADIFTVQGKMIASLSGSAIRPAVWNLADDCGRQVPSGKYLARIVSGKTIANAALAVVR